ncbi:MAG: toll/interleukin-1 receptor domain-containing protein [Acidobacteriota bacterium]
MPHDVFISYATSDRPVADAVCAGLESRGLQCWIAPRDIVPGLDWGAAIIDAISECRVMLLVFSSSANTSKQIKREVERAVAKGVTIIPLRIEDVPLGKTLEYFISTPHWMDALSRPLEPHIEHLAETIRTLLARPSRTTDDGVVPEREADEESAPAPRSRRRAGKLPPPPPSLTDEKPRARERGREGTAPGTRRFQPLVIGAAVAAVLLVLILLGVFRSAPPQILSVQFPTRIYADNQPASGMVFFRARKNDIASARFDVLQSAGFPPFSFSVQGAPAKRDGSISFYIHTPIVQRMTLRAVLLDSAGHESNQVPFSFDVVPVPPPAANFVPKHRFPTPRGFEVQAPNGFRFKVR